MQIIVIFCLFAPYLFSNVARFDGLLISSIADDETSKLDIIYRCCSCPLFADLLLLVVREGRSIDETMSHATKWKDHFRFGKYSCQQNFPLHHGLDK